MKKIILFFLFAWTGLSLFAQTDRSELDKQIGYAIMLMDNGAVDESIEALNELRKTVPDDFIIQYELAYAYYLKQDYAAAIKVLKKLRKNKDAEDILYQLLGNSYDVAGNPKLALGAYKQGLKRFPNSGRLYFEQGVVYGTKYNDFNTALACFEKGIEMDPAYPSNYFWASKLFCESSDEEIWGMIYGELFLNLEPGTQRTEEISRLLYDTYQSEITFPNDTTVSVSFSRNNVIDFAALIDAGRRILSVLPYGMAVYEATLSLASIGEKEIGLASLNRIRTAFLENYYKNFGERFPNALFAYQKEVAAAGHLEAYNYWVVSAGDPQGFLVWHDENPEKWEAFVQWFETNPIRLDGNNRFYRGQY